AREPPFVVDHQLEGAGGVHHVLREAARQLRELPRDRLQLLLLRRRERGAVTTEVVERLFEEAAARGREMTGFLALGEFDQPPVQALVQRQRGKEGGHLGNDRVV